MLKKKHAEDHPNYVYNPRKPSDMKRRMTSRKAAALVNTGGNVVGVSSSLNIARPQVPSTLASSYAVAGPSNYAPTPAVQQVAPVVSAIVAKNKSAVSTNTVIPESSSTSVAPDASSTSVVSDECSTAIAPNNTSSSVTDNTTPNVAETETVMIDGEKNSQKNAASNTIHLPQTECTQTVGLMTYDPVEVGFMEFEDGHLGLNLPMEDDVFAKIILEHNAFLEANPKITEPVNRTSFTVEFDAQTENDIAELDTQVNWDQIGEDYGFVFEENDNEFAAFFDQELERLQSGN
jgi:hypothetical protein